MQLILKPHVTPGGGTQNVPPHCVCRGNSFLPPNLLGELAVTESQQLLRQWKLLQMLAESRFGILLTDLATQFEVSDRTIRRDLVLLQAAGFKIEELNGDQGRKRWKMKSFAEQTGFTVTELLSILVAQRFLEPLAGTPFWTGMHRVYNKIRHALGEQAIRYLHKLSGSLHATSVGASDYSQRGGMIDQLILAIEDRLITLIVYQSDQATEPVEQEVYPQGFVFHRGSLYLIAWSSRRGEIRTFKMDRIEDVHVTKIPAVVPDEFDLEEWLEHSFGVFRSGNTELLTIRVHFSRDVARYVRESRWHRSQKLFPQSDGSLIVDFQLADTQEIKRWIMSFGPSATVLEPPELVDEIQSDLMRMLEAYAPTP